MTRASPIGRRARAPPARVGGGARCQCRIARLPRSPSAASSGRKEVHGSPRSTRLLAELPGYRNGPYADLRKWLEGELDRTRVRAKVTHATRCRCAARAPRRSRSSARRTRQVVAAASALGHPDQDRRLRLHDASPRPCADADRRRARPARRDPRPDRRRARGPRRRPRAARRASERGRDRLLPRGERAAGEPSRSSGGRSPRPGSRSARSWCARRPTSSASDSRLWPTTRVSTYRCSTTRASTVSARRSGG